MEGVMGTDVDVERERALPVVAYETPVRKGVTGRDVGLRILAGGMWYVAVGTSGTFSDQISIPVAKRLVLTLVFGMVLVLTGVTVKERDPWGILWMAGMAVMSAGVMWVWN
jgi:hypothetical protein